MEISKFECEKCQFKCNFMSQWNDHINSKKHTGEKRKERCDKILSEKCELCDYKPTKTTNMKLYKTTSRVSCVPSSIITRTSFWTCCTRNSILNKINIPIT